MAQFDLTRTVDPTIAGGFANQALASPTMTQSDYLDTLGYESLALFVFVPTHTAGTISIKVQESSDLSTWTDLSTASAADINANFVGQATGLIAYTAAETGSKRMGVMPTKRYARIVATVGATPSGVITAMWAQARPKHRAIAV